MKIFSNEKSSLMDVWRTSLKLCKVSLRSIVKILILSFMVSLTTIIINWYVSPNVVIIGYNKVLFFGGYSIMLLIQMYLMIVLLSKFYTIGNGHLIADSSTYAFARKKFSVFLLYSITGVLLYSLAASLIILHPSMGVIFVVVLLVSFITVFIVNMQPIILFSDKGYFCSIRDGIGLVWGNWWRSLTVFLPFVFLGQGINYLIFYYIFRYGFVATGIFMLSLIAVLLHVLVQSCVVVNIHDLQIRKHKKNMLVV